MSVYSIILAAGDGKRMKSNTAKPLMNLGGNPMILWALKAAKEAGAKKQTVVAGYKAEEIMTFCGEGIDFAVQEEQSGIFDAIACGIAALKEKEGTALVLCADTPLVLADTLKSALAEHEREGRAVTVITDSASESGKAYLIDLKAAAEAQNISEFIRTADNSGVYTAEPGELLSVSDRIKLAAAEKILNKRKLESLMLEGVTITDPDNTYIGAEVKIGIDTVILPGTHISGDTVIGYNCEIGPNSIIDSCKIGNNTSIVSSKLIESTVGSEVNIGPFAYLRPNSKISDKVKIGDFVEIKNSNIDEGTKVAHLTYIGDADVGSNVNFGCGTVVVNYDGKKKHRTKIGNNAFIGCNSNLVSPVTVKDGAYTAAGSTITEEVPENALAIARARQVNKENWVKR